MKDGAWGVVRRGWSDVPGLTWVDEAIWSGVVGVGEDVMEVWAECGWKLLRRDPVLPCVQVTRSVDGVGM